VLRRIAPFCSKILADRRKTVKNRAVGDPHEDAKATNNRALAVLD